MKLSGKHILKSKLIMEINKLNLIDIIYNLKVNNEHQLSNRNLIIHFDVCYYKVKLMIIDK